jgi:hypothetical protein
VERDTPAADVIRLHFTDVNGVEVEALLSRDEALALVIALIQHLAAMRGVVRYD